jgi:hypothetical protein
MAPTATDQQLATEIHELRRDFHEFRVDVAERLGAIQSRLEGFRGRTETGFGVAKWGVGLAAGAILSLIASAMAGTWYAAKLDSRVQQLESRAPVDHPVKGAR